MTHALRALLVHGSGIALLSLAGLALAGPKHAQTLYDEPPKYPANFQHFDYVNPDAPKGGSLRQAGFGVDEKRVRAHGSGGARHVIWLATRKL